MQELDGFFRRQDVFVVDREFRDSIEFLEFKDYIPKMPKQAGEKKQHSTE